MILEVDILAGLLRTQVMVVTFRSACVIVVFNGIKWNNIHAVVLKLCRGKDQLDLVL